MGKNISKKIADILKEGTPKQKAILICMDYRDRGYNNQAPLLTEEEAKAIRDSIKDVDEGKEFNKWIAIYNTYVNIAPLFGLAWAEYKASANDLLCTIRQWEDYTNEENHLNTIIADLKEKKNDEALKTFYESLKYIDLPKADIILDKDGFVVVDVGNPEDYSGGLYEDIIDKRADVYNTYATLKAMVIVVEKWTAKVKGKAIMPPSMIDVLKQAKSDYSLTIAPAYSEKQLRIREERGEDITAYERMRAVYPEYDRLQASEYYLDILKERIESIYAHEKN